MLADANLQGGNLMSNIVIIYWSGTGNTETMANAIAEGINLTDNKSEVYEVSDFSKDISTFDKIIFGCPAMGSEVLEESVFEPFFSDIENKLNGKKVALFGSYDWGDCQWMRDWEDRVKDNSAVLFEYGLTINNSPDSDGVDICKAFGERFSEF